MSRVETGPYVFISNPKGGCSFLLPKHCFFENRLPPKESGVGMGTLKVSVGSAIGFLNRLCCSKSEELLNSLRVYCENTIKIVNLR